MIHEFMYLQTKPILGYTIFNRLYGGKMKLIREIVKAYWPIAAEQILIIIWVW